MAFSSRGTERTRVPLSFRMSRGRTRYRSTAFASSRSPPQSKTLLMPPGSKPSAFHRVVQRSPLRRSRTRCPLGRLPDRRALARDTHVPPSCFPSTSTVCSTAAPRACCSPQPTMGFNRFPRDGRVCRATRHRIPRMPHPPAPPHRQPGSASPRTATPSPFTRPKTGSTPGLGTIWRPGSIRRRFQRLHAL